MYRLTGVHPKLRYALYGLCLFVLAASVIIVLAYNNHFYLGSLDKLDNDDVKYIHSARMLLQSGTLVYNSGSEPTTYIMPGVPLVLALFMSVFGQEEGGIVAFRLFQCVLQAASVYLVFCIARRVFHDRAALIAAILCACYIPDYFSSGAILSETSFKFLLLLMISLMIEAVDSRKPSLYIVFGLLLGAAAYFKPHVSLLPAALLFFWWRRKYTLKESAVRMAWIAAVFCLLLAPWWVRNAVVFHKFIPFTESAGNPFLLGTLVNGQNPGENFYLQYPQYKETLFVGSDADAIETGKQIIAFELRERPFTYIRWFFYGKVKELYMHPYYWREFWGIPESAVYTIQHLLSRIAGLGILISLLAGRETRSRSMYLLLPLGYMTAIYIPFVAFSRYGYPNMFLLIMYASYLIWQTGTLIQTAVRALGAKRRRNQSAEA